MRPLALLLALGLSAAAADLAQTINTLIDGSALKAHSEIGVHVVELRTGRVLYAHDENRFFMPASNMKLFTTGLALLKLGPDYRFETRLVQEASGDLALVGSGDPSMSARVYPYGTGSAPNPPLHAIEDLAQQAVNGGLTRVRGDIVGDDTLYPWVPYPENWTQNDMGGENGAPVSALTVSDNLITVNFLPGAKPGDLGQLSLSPSLEYYAIDNRILTVAGSGDPQIRMIHTPGKRQLMFEGTIPMDGPRRFALVPIDEPALYAACALYDALTRRGVSISGRPVARHRSPADAYAAPTGTILATRSSPPASQLIQMTDKISENLHAELLLREVARTEYRNGTVENGVAALNTFFGQIGAEPNEARIDDGSGLSRFTLVTPHLITRLLAHMWTSKARESWLYMLPIGGADGTLVHRLCCTEDAHAIHAKTGTLSRSIALSGYANSKTHGWLAFSILVNDFAASQGEIHAWVDKIALAMVE